MTQLKKDDIVKYIGNDRFMFIDDYTRPKLISDIKGPIATQWIYEGKTHKGYFDLNRLEIK